MIRAVTNYYLYEWETILNMCQNNRLSAIYAVVVVVNVRLFHILNASVIPQTPNTLNASRDAELIEIKYDHPFTPNAG